MSIQNHASKITHSYRYKSFVLVQIMSFHAFILIAFLKNRKKRDDAKRLVKQDASAKNPRPESNYPAAFSEGSPDIGRDMNAAAKVDAQAPLPVFDPLMGVQLTFGDRDTWQTILGMLLDSLPEYSANLIAAKYVPEDLWQVAHKLVSASCYCGTPAMNDAAKQVVHLAKTGSVDLTTKALDALLQQIERLQALKQDGNLPEGKNRVY